MFEAGGEAAQKASSSELALTQVRYLRLPKRAHAAACKHISFNLFFCISCVLCVIVCVRVFFGIFTPIELELKAIIG